MGTFWSEHPGQSLEIDHKPFHLIPT